MSVLVLEPSGYSPEALALYRRLGPVHLGLAPDPATVEILVVRLRHFIGAELLGEFRQLRVVVSPTTGLNHIDMVYCERAGIRVATLRDCAEALEQVTSTSELTWALLLSLLRRLPQAHADVTAQGRWDRDRFEGRQVKGLRLGLVGFGRIGRHMAGYAQAFGMRVSACDPYVEDMAFAQRGVERVSMEQVLAGNDILSMHAKHTSETDGLIGAREIARMPAGAFLINTARGEILDEKAAADAVRSGHLAGVAVDVLALEHEVAADLSRSPLVAAARDGFNVLMTPHIGGRSRDAMRITEDLMAAHVLNEVMSHG